MFDEYESLNEVRETADVLASSSDWPELYDEAQLAKNEIPVYAAAFYDDMYVDFDHSMETAGKIKGCKTFITNTMYHNAIGSKAEAVMEELFAMRNDIRD